MLASSIASRCTRWRRQQQQQQHRQQGRSYAASTALRHAVLSRALWFNTTSPPPCSNSAGDPQHDDVSTPSARQSTGHSATTGGGAAAVSSSRSCSHCNTVLAAAAVALSLWLALPGTVSPAAAYTVNLDDVKNPAMQEGVRAAMTGNYPEAEKIFKAMLQSDEDEVATASVWSNLGNVHMSLHRPGDAVNDYDHAIELAPDAPVPYLNRAIAREELGVQLADQQDWEHALAMWQEAISDCDHAISLDSQQYAAFFNKGNVDMRLGDYQAALRDFTQAADLAPGIAGYRLRAAQVMYQVDDSGDRAARIMRGVARKYPNYAEAHASLAAALYHDGKVAAAEEQFEAAMQLDARWRDMEFVRSSTRWPPALYSAMQQLVSLT